MSTKERVYELVERRDSVRLDIERLNEDRRSALEWELSSILLRFGRRDESEESFDGESGDDGVERPYDLLGKLIGMIGDDCDWSTDMSANKYKDVAETIQHW